MVPYGVSGSPRNLYDEYQARVAKAVRNYERIAAAPRTPGRLTRLLARFEARLVAVRIYPARHEVAEDGYLA